MRRRCIAPPGASVANHRFEQAALSVALARRNILCHNRWDLYAYLEEEQRESATPIDRANGRATGVLRA
ncbi:hypothetical protein T484DRAFT_1789152 [Baffinella frigidus]|nr:hypothetical protein T484DRAFT_1789152 [Cryptophyta sp. CCMP2293]